jgi:hypothetical protein
VWLVGDASVSPRSLARGRSTRACRRVRGADHEMQRTHLLRDRPDRLPRYTAATRDQPSATNGRLRAALPSRGKRRRARTGQMERDAPPPEPCTSEGGTLGRRHLAPHLSIEAFSTSRQQSVSIHAGEARHSAHHGKPHLMTVQAARDWTTGAWGTPCGLTIHTLRSVVSSFLFGRRPLRASTVKPPAVVSAEAGCRARGWLLLNRGGASHGEGRAAA